jgi:molecular chaperone GrpE
MEDNKTTKDDLDQEELRHTAEDSQTEDSVQDTEGPAEEPAEAAEEKASADSEKLDEGFFKKKKKKDKKDEQIEELTDRLKRQMAEFDNFRKRTEKEKTQMFEIGAKDIIERILPVVDNFERGLAAVSEEDKDSPIVQGMEQIYKQLVTCLEEAGVTVIEAEGQTFDPNLHNAVMHVDDDAYGENVVAEEFQKGYKYRDSIVRHSMVKVAN